MAKRTRYIEIDDLLGERAWKQLVEDVHATGETAIIRAGDEDVAELRPARPRAQTSRHQGKSTSKDDPFWKLVGTANSGSPSDVSEHVDDFLAEALKGSSE